jgi:hypothetical protein
MRVICWYEVWAKYKKCKFSQIANKITPIEIDNFSEQGFNEGVGCNRAAQHLPSEK